VGLTEQNASQFLVSYLSDDALTWWRSYSASNGGITGVFNNKDYEDILDDLQEQFTDVDKFTSIRNKLFNLK
jgi:hypothetical protein